MCKVGQLSPQVAGHMLPSTHCCVARGDSNYLPGKTEAERRRNFETYELCINGETLNYQV